MDVVLDILRKDHEYDLFKGFTLDKLLKDDYRIGVINKHLSRIH